MSSDEDDELAALRSQRAARMGAAGLTRTALRQQIDERYGTRQGEHNEDGDEDEGADDDANGSAPNELGEEADRMDDDMRQHFPMAFGLQEQRVSNPLKVHAQTARSSRGGDDQLVGPSRPAQAPGHDGDDDRLMGPPRPSTAAAGGGEGGNGVGGEFVGPPRPAGAREPALEPEDAEEEEEDPYNLPITHEVQLKGFERMVSALDVEHSGSRVAAGGHDYMVRLYDFNGMKADAKPFREFEPAEGHPLLALSWSPTGEALLVVTGASQAKIYDRDGVQRGEFVRGDMYIRDMKNTKGHISGLTGGQWHPVDRYSAMTSSDDGSIRIWDTHNLLQSTVVKPTPLKPGRVAVTGCCYNGDGTLICCGIMDGTLQLWDVRGKFGRSAAVGQVLPPKPQMHEQNKWSYVSGSKKVIRNAHEAQSEISGLAISSDGTTLATRGGDETLKLWDLRTFKAPLHCFADLPSLQPNTNCCFSPDGALVLTGTAADRAGLGGSLAFFDCKKLQLVRRIGMPSTVVTVKWSARINQIFAATGDRKSGAPRVLYDPRFSERGALLSVARKPRAKDSFDFQAPLVIHNPNALPMYRDNAIRKRKRGEEEAIKAASSRNPDAGKHVQGPGRHGKIGTTGGTILTQYLLKSHGMLHNPDEEDVRASILRHAEQGEDPRFAAYTAAYNETQPVPIFAKPDEDEDGGEGKEEK